MRLSIILSFFFALTSLSVIAQPTVGLGNDTTICQGQSLTLDAANAGSTFSWSTGETTQIIIVDTTGVYWVDVDDGVGVSRDTVLVSVLDTIAFSVSDTTICGGELSLSVDGDSSGVYLWWDAAVGGNLVNAGATLTDFFFNDTSYYIESRNWDTTSLYQVGPAFASGGGYYTVAGSPVRGAYFDIFDPIILETIDFYSSGNLTGLLEVLDPSGNIVHTQNLSFTGTGMNLVTLNLELFPANDYLIRFTRTGGSVYIDFSGGYPYSSAELSIKSGVPVSAHYNCLYNWQYRKTACASSRQQLFVDVSSTPSYDLPADTLVCGGSLDLDLSATGGTSYQWSTGETTASVTLVQSDTVTVDVAIGTCVSSDTMIAFIIDTVAFNVVDTAVCGGEASFGIQGDTSKIYLWYDASTSGNLVHTGHSLTDFIYNDTTHYIEARNWDFNTSYYAGLEDNIGNSTNGNYYPVSGNPVRGIYFDVLEPIILETVDLYSSGNLMGLLEVFDPNNNLIHSANISETGTGAHPINLNLELLPGSNYLIRFTRSTGDIFIDYSVTYPFTYDAIIMTGGAPTASHYNCFYNWVYRKTTCPTVRKDLNITFTPTPVSNLPSDTLICGGPAVLDVGSGNINTNYLWSTGETTSSVTISNSDTLTLISNIGACIAMDTIVVYVTDTVAFSVSDTTICGVEMTLSVDGDTNGVYLWWDQLSGGNLINIGSSYQNNFNSSANYYIEASSWGYNEYYAGFPSNGNSSSGNYFGVAQLINIPRRGMRFDVYEIVRLEGVDLYIQGSVNGIIELSDSSGAVLESKAISLVGNGAEPVSLGWTLPIGVDYELSLTLQSGTGSVYVDFPVSYPMNTAELSIKQGFPFGAYYNYLYNWRLKKPSCPTARQELSVQVLPTPILDLPEDTLVCGEDLILDLSSSNGTFFNWSTGGTTSSEVIALSDLVIVDVGIGTCFKSDTIQVYRLDTVQFSLTDTSLCGGEFNYSINGDSSGLYLWYDSELATQAFAVGQDIDFIVYDTATYYAEGYSFYPYTLSAGLTAIGSTASAGYYYGIPNEARGLLFNVKKDLYLESVEFYSEGNVFGFIQIKDNSGNLLHNKFYQFNHSGAIRLDFNTYLPVGNNYQILFQKSGGDGGVYADLPLNNFPLEYQYIDIKEGTPYDYVYNYFYNWEYRELACPTNRQAMTINTFPTVNTSSWPQDSIVCTDTLILDASYPGATYNWSTGATSGGIVITQSDTVWLSATVGSCTTEDTLNVLLTNPPNFASVLTDTTICPGDITIFAQSDGYTQAWYSSETSPSPIAFGDSINLNLSDTATYWIEGINFLLRPNFYGEAQYPYPQGGGFEDVANSNYKDRGMNFDVFEPIILNELSVFADTAIVTTISLIDQYGYSLYSQSLNLTAGENILNLDWFIEPASNYRLMLTNLSDGGLYLISNYSFPVNYDEFRIRSGYPVSQSNDYNYFFKWRISTLGCATDRHAVTINVLEEPKLALPSDTAFCNASTGMPLFATGSNDPNYSYQWNTNETTDSIFVTNSGIYEVTVTANGLCSSTSNINVQFLTPPSVYQANDSSICYSSEVSLLSPPNEGLLVWSRLPNNGLTIHLGAPYNTYIQDSTTYELEMAARAITRLGDLTHPNLNDPGQYQSFIISNTFDVMEATILDSVAVYMEQAPATFDIILRDGSNQEIERRSFTINQAQTKVFVPLDWVILPSNQYRLEFDNVSSDFLVNQNTVYPQTSSAGVVELTGTSFAGVSYNCFYDWHFSYAFPGCSAGSLDSFTVNVNLPLNLQDSIYACDTAVLNTSNGATTYLWNTGEITDSIVAYAPGLYTVSMTDGGSCSVVDSIRLGNPIPIGLPTNNSLCGIVLGTNYSTTTATDFLWSTGDSTSSISLPSTGTYSVTITTNDGCVISDTTFINQIENPPAVNIGTFLTFCGPDTLDAGFGGFGLSYQWSTGDSSQTIIVDSPGNYAVTVATPNGCAGSDDTFVDFDSLPNANYNYTLSGSSVALTNISQNADNYYWDFGDGSTTTFVQPFHSFPNNGCYDVMLVAFNDCGSDTIIQTVAIGVNQVQCDTTINAVNLNEVEELEMTIFPNPNNGKFKLEFNQTVEDLQMIEVYNAQGQKVWEENIQAASTTGINLNLINLPAGVYYLSCFTASKRYMQTFVVKQY